MPPPHGHWALHHGVRRAGMQRRCPRPDEPVPGLTWRRRVDRGHYQRVHPPHRRHTAPVCSAAQAVAVRPLPVHYRCPRVTPDSSRSRTTHLRGTIAPHRRVRHAGAWVSWTPCHGRPAPPLKRQPTPYRLGHTARGNQAARFNCRAGWPLAKPVMPSPERRALRITVLDPLGDFPQNEDPGARHPDLHTTGTTQCMNPITA